MAVQSGRARMPLTALNDRSPVTLDACLLQKKVNPSRSLGVQEKNKIS
jgi:hypothetical protein